MLISPMDAWFWRAGAANEPKGYNDPRPRPSSGWLQTCWDDLAQPKLAMAIVAFPREDCIANDGGCFEHKM